MSIKHLALALLGTALLSAPAFAQTNPPAAPTPNAQAANTSTWLTREQPGQWRASKVKGLNVYNQNNDKIGDIRDLLVDNSGNIQAVVIGVGGFLGMGEHDVAVPMDQLSFVTAPRTAATTAAPPATAPNAPTTTGSVTTAPTAAAANRSVPDHAVLNATMTKDQLKAAPEFKFNR